MSYSPDDYIYDDLKPPPEVESSPPVESSPTQFDVPTSALPPVDTLLYGYSYGDVLEAGAMAVSNASWFTSSPEYRAFQDRMVANNPPDAKTVEASPGKTAEGRPGKGLIDKITGFVDKNKSLTEMVLKGISGATAASQARKLSDQNSRNRIGELQEADRLKQADNARISASVSGLRQPGIIRRQMPLKRIDGTPIFNNGRIGG